MRRTGKRAPSASIATVAGACGANTYSTIYHPRSRLVCFWPDPFATIFPKEFQLLLNGPIRKAEQDRLFFGLVGYPLPARDHEDVSRPPVEGHVADRRRAAALDRGEHRGIRR